MVLFSTKNTGFFLRNADITKIKKAVLLNDVFSETASGCAPIPSF